MEVIGKGWKVTEEVRDHCVAGKRFHAGGTSFTVCVHGSKQESLVLNLTKQDYFNYTMIIRSIILYYN